MIHEDWAAWDAWMEANDHLVQQGIVPTVDEITRKVDFAPSPITDRDRNIEEMHKFNRDVANLEEGRIHSMERGW